jgi:hypothetical protein
MPWSNSAVASAAVFSLSTVAISRAFFFKGWL